MELVLAKYPAGEFPDIAGTSLYNRRPTTEVPLVIGLAMDEAEDEVFDAHLNPEFEEIASLEEAGAVVEVEPEAGQTLDHGATVIVRISSGVPPELAVPLLTGLSVGEASQQLTSLQEELLMIITVNVVYEETPNPALIDKVVRTEPDTGALVPHEGTLTLAIGIEPTPPPDP